MRAQEDTGEGFPLELVSFDLSNEGELHLRFAASGKGASDAAFTSTPQVTSGIDVRLAEVAVEAELTPVEVASMQALLVVDVSGSMAGAPLETAKESAKDFIEILPPNVEIGIVAFGAEAQVVQAPTTDRVRLTTALDTLEAGGETALYDGVMTALRIEAPADRLPVIVLSDGGDTASTATLDDVLEALDVAPHQVHGIALTTGESNFDALNALAEASGGSQLSTDSPEGLGMLYRDLGTLVASEYEMVVPLDREGPATLQMSLPGEGAQPVVWSKVFNLPELPGRVAGMERAWSEPEPYLHASAGLAADPVLVWVGASLLYLSLFVLVLLGVTREPKLVHRTSVQIGTSRPSRLVALDDTRQAAVRLVEEFLQARAAERLAARIDAAGLRLRVGEVVMATAGLAFGLTTLAFVLAGPVAGAVGLAIGLVIPRLYLSFRQSRRSKAFASQLPDILVALANVLRVGYSMNRGLAAVAQEADEPARSELRRAIVEARMGGSLVAALRSVAERTNSVDLIWVVDAVEINTAVGGDMVGVLDNVAGTIRSRVTLAAQVSALTAEGRMSALVLLLLPPGLSAFIATSNPAYFEGVFDRQLGWVMAGTSFTLLLGGALWIRKMIGSVG